MTATFLTNKTHIFQAGHKNIVILIFHCKQNVHHISLSADGLALGHNAHIINKSWTLHPSILTVHILISY